MRSRMKNLDKFLKQHLSMQKNLKKFFFQKEMIRDFEDSTVPGLGGQGREKLAHLEIKGPNCKEENLERKNGPV